MQWKESSESHKLAVFKRLRSGWTCNNIKLWEKLYIGLNIEANKELVQDLWDRVFFFRLSIFPVYELILNCNETCC